MLRRNITPFIILLSFVARIQLKMVVLSKESGTKAKLQVVLLVRNPFQL